MRSATTALSRPPQSSRTWTAARHLLAAVEEHGIGLDDIMDKLVADGVKLFSAAFDKLLGAIEVQRSKLAG